MVELVDTNVNDPDITNYSINYLCVNTKVFAKEFLKLWNVPDITSITIFSEDYVNLSNNLTQEQIENIMFPLFLSSLKQKFKS